MLYVKRYARNVITKLLVVLLLTSTLSLGGFQAPGKIYGAAPQITDIDSSYARKEIEQLTAAGIINGYKDGTFAPLKPITRAELAKVMALVSGLPEQPDEANRFSDVAEGSWHRGYIGALVAAGIVQGTSASTFSPDSYVTREQLAVLYIRAFGLEKQALKERNAVKWSDAENIADWAKPYVALAFRIGFLKGIAGNDGSFRFAPQDFAERQAAARLAFEFMTNFEAYKQAGEEQNEQSPTTAPTSTPEPSLNPSPTPASSSGPANEPTPASTPVPTDEPTSEPTTTPTPEPTLPPLEIVRNGQANAVIVVDDTVYEREEIPEPNGIRGWKQEYGTGSIAVSDERSHSGIKSLHIQAADNGSYGIISDPVAITGGVSYTLSAAVYRESGRDPQVFIRYYDANKVRIAQQGSIRAIPLAEWQNVSYTAAAPPSAAYAAVILFTSMAPANLYFDDVALKSASDENMPITNPGFEPIVSSSSPAIDTLVEYVHISTNTLLPVLTEAEYLSEGVDPDTIVIRLGTAQSVSGIDPALDVLLEGLSRDGFVIYPQEHQVVIAGAGIWGAVNGVNNFLERYAGVRWLMPGPDGEDVPQRSDLLVARDIVREEPAFDFRVFSPLHAKPNNSVSVWQEQYKWAQRNGMQGFYNAPISFHHNMYNLFPISKYGVSNPEFYPNGIPPAANSIQGWQPCFSNPDTIDAAVTEILAYFEANPNSQSYSLGTNDGNGFCESDPVPVYFNWVNQVVERVLEVYPDKWFGFLVYQAIDRPPSFQLNPRVIPFITKDRTAWLDSDQKAQDLADHDSWLEVTQQVAYYDYIYGSPYLVPRVYPHLMADNFRIAHDRGVTSLYAELYPNWGEGAKAWVAAKLLWDPDLNVDALLQEWYSRAVGEAAAPYLEDYYEHWEQFWTERAIEEPWFLPGVIYQTFHNPSYLKAVTTEDIEISRGLLEQVVANAGTDKQQARANLLMKAFEYYEASVLSYPQANEPPADTAAALVLLEEAVDTFEERLQMAEKRIVLLEQFRSDPALFQPFDARSFNQLMWSGWNVAEFWQLVEYMREQETSGGPVRTRAADLSATHSSLRAREFATMLLHAVSEPNLVLNPSFQNSEAGDATKAPPWELLSRSTASRVIQRVEGTGYTDNASMMVYGKGWGGPSQVIDVQPGLVDFSFHYHMPAGGNTSASMQWGFDLLDDQGNWLNFSTVRSPVTALEDAEGVWLEARLTGEIPATVNGIAVSKVRLNFLVESAQPIELYIDDVQFYNAASGN
jgi:hypothetical protein